MSSGSDNQAQAVVVLMAMGNRWRGDDAAGPAVVDRLGDVVKSTANCRIVERVDDAMSMINAWDGARDLLVVNRHLDGDPAEATVDAEVDAGPPDELRHIAHHDRVDRADMVPHAAPIPHDGLDMPGLDHREARANRSKIGREVRDRVGEDEADIKAQLISVGSPIARALIGKEEGDVITVEAPSGNKEYEIVGVKYV